LDNIFNQGAMAEGTIVELARGQLTVFQMRRIENLVAVVSV
jgi:hypothetical protein